MALGVPAGAILNPGKPVLSACLNGATLVAIMPDPSG
jgi:hypothetical protein